LSSQQRSSNGDGIDGVDAPLRHRRALLPLTPERQIYARDVNRQAERRDRLAGEQGFDFALLVDAWSQMPARSWRSAGRMRV